MDVRQRFRSLAAIKFMPKGTGRRILALFFLIGFIAGVAVPPLSAYAETRPDPDIANSHVKAVDPKTANKPMKQNYPSAMPAQAPKTAPAADYAQRSAAAIPGITGNPTPIAAAQGLQSQPVKKTFKEEELVEKRTANTSTFRNKDGSFSTKQYYAPKFFKKSDKWQGIDTTLIEDKNAADAGNIFGQVLGQVKSWTAPTTTYTIKDNDWHARFAPSNDKAGMVRIKKGESQIGFSPQGAKNVVPVITTAKDGKQAVHYYDLWPGVDVEYSVHSAEVKESIILKNKNATNKVEFKIDGAQLKKQSDKSGPAYTIEGALNNDFAITPANLILNNFGLETDHSVFSQTYKDDKLSISVDKAYLAKLPIKAFPAVVDPTTVNRSSFGTRAGGNYLSYKSDGYVCYSNECNLYAGSLVDTNGYWRTWRGEFHAPYQHLIKGKQLNSAKLHLTQRTGVSWYTGTSGPATFSAWRSDCHGYDCVRPGSWSGETTMTTEGDINVTSIYQNAAQNNEWEAWVMLLGTEGASLSFKNMDPDNTYVEFSYTDILPSPGIISPAYNQVFVDPQVSFTSSTYTHPSTGAPLKYNFCVSSSGGCGGAVMVSGAQASAQWTIPDGLLQDGSTYYIQAQTHDSATGVYSSYGPAIPFRIDARTGKDSTQAYDTLGPVSADLATGNLSTSSGSHTSAALGGSLGISLDYNSPLRSRNGLVGKYFNNTSLSGDPAMTRVDQQVAFNWQYGSPASNVINPDNFSVRWEGYFVAPQTGSYQFGSDVDDGCRIWVNEQLLVDNWTLCGAQYGSTALSLSAGQVVRVKMEHNEAGGLANATLKVKGVVSASGMTVPSTWLHTGVRDANQQNGLTGRYYKDNGTHDFNDGANTLFMQRNDPLVSFAWGAGAAAPGGSTDNFMARWTGYVTAPVSGTYEFGTVSDDGSRIYVGTSSTLVYNKWQDSPGTEGYGTGIALTAGQPTPITVDYFENLGSATMYLKVRNTAAGIAEQVVPTSWLSPKAQVLPDGWNMGIDPDGNLSYDRLKVSQNSVILTDSTGSTHEYTWAEGAYKPPVNEDGQLVRNDDGTYTLQDIDGRTYIFNADGTVSSVTSPVDDAKPAALQYAYAGTPSRLTQITDGVTTGRWAKVYYSGDTNCTAAPATFDAQAPAGMLCAVKTNDGRTTAYFYKSGKLARVQAPGNVITDYQYDTFGRIVAVRDGAANDAVAAGVRADDATVNTSIDYDALGRVVSVTQPAATTGATRGNHTIDYTNTGTVQWRNAPTISDTVAGRVIPVSWGGKRVDLFARGVAGDLIHRFTDDGINWSSWESLGGCIMYDPGVAAWGPGRLDIVVQGCNTTGNNVYHKWFDAAYGGWHDFEQFAGIINSSPSVVSWGYGRLDIFARATNNQMVHKWYDMANGSWYEWESFGGCAGGSPAAVTTVDHRLDAFVQNCEGSGNNLSRFSYTTGGWSGQVNLPVRVEGAISAATVGTDKVEIVAPKTSTTQAHFTFTQGANTIATNADIAACSATAPSLGSVDYTMTMYTRDCASPSSAMHVSHYAMPQGTTTQRVTGTSEPNGFSRRVEYDSLLRTTKDTDIANLTNTTEWHSAKDLVLSTTDATGLKATTIYDDDDRISSNYGPAPAAWYGTDRKPLTAYAAQVPRTDVAYDEGIQGPDIAYYPLAVASKTLSGAPKLHTTSFSNTSPASIGRNYGTTSPVPGSTNDWGLRATGKLRLPATGSYTFRVWSDGGVRLYIDDELILNDWNDGGQRNHPLISHNNVAGSVHRFRLEYYHRTSDANIGVYLSGPGLAETLNWGNYLTPGYNLTTSAKVYDSTLGNGTAVTNYGSNPELGLAQSTSIDPTGLNLTVANTYETQGATDSFLRQTSKTLPGSPSNNPSFAYTHYGPTDTRDNPCTAGTTEAYKQAGFLKIKTEADPDGTGSQTGRKSEVIYDDSGKAVAARFNTEDWACTAYDSRGRVTTAHVPAYGNSADRTVTNNWAMGGNPLQTAVYDGNGWIITNTDLLGRTTSYTDVYGQWTGYEYNSTGQLSRKFGDMGEEIFYYDSYHRMANHVFDGVTYATVYYDAYSRVDHIDYNNAGQMRLTPGRDSLGRTNTKTYRMGDGTTTVVDTVNRTQSGQITNNIVQSGSNELWYNYGYDSVGRLTSSNIGPNSFSYGFGPQHSSCGAGNNMNPNSGKNGNRTTQTINGVTTTFCYDYADRLVDSSDALYDNPQYDSRGNMTQIGTNSTPMYLYYDSSDRGSGYEQYTSSGNGVALYYDRDVQGRIMGRYKSNVVGWDWQTAGNWFYGYTGAGDTPDFVRDSSWNIVEKTLQLPGGVNLTVKPQETGNNQKQYSLSNTRGSTLLTANAAGTNTSTGNGPANSFTYDPFGTILPGSTLPANTGGGSYGWAGQYEKMTENTFTLVPISMGARIYLAGIGRFTQVDPVEGGAANNYVYALDPINMNDFSGMCILQCAASVSYFQPARVVTTIQTAASVARVQGASAPRVQATAAAKPASPAASPARRPVVTGISISQSASKAGGAVLAGATWFGQGIKSGVQENSSHIRAGVVGCGVGVTGTAAVAYAIAAGAGGQFEISAGAVAFGCLTGGTSAVLDSVAPGSGSGVDALSQAKDAYDIYMLFLGR